MRTYCAGRKLLDLGAGKPGKGDCDNGELHVWQVAVCGKWCEALGCSVGCLSLTLLSTLRC